tara:strand:+ start:552 stop:1109 length:558 start_codon:yes stop_codon:yes gene_type:complete
MIKIKNNIKEREKNTMTNVIAKLDYNLNDGPEEKKRLHLMNVNKKLYNELYEKMINNTPIKGDRDPEKYAIAAIKYHAYKSGYRVKEELDGDNGPSDLILERIKDGVLQTHRIDSKGIHPNAKQKPAFKVTGANEKFLERNKIYQRKIAIVYRGQIKIREGWHVNTPKEELKVFDHDTSKQGYIA